MTRALIFVIMLAAMRGRNVSMTNVSQNNVGKGEKGVGQNNGKSRDYEDTRLTRPTAVLQKMVPVLEW